MQSMTHAEKTMLRYQYVLANTGAASSDFQRTISSWHNQIVLLTGGFQQLASIVGGVLTNAFKPFIQALNSVMGAIINFAQVVSDALGAIFGWEYQTGGGVSQDLEFGAGAAGDIEDAMGGAADKAKEMNKYIAGWHEVNNMTSNESSGGTGGGGGSGSGSGSLADGGEWIHTESIWEKYTSDIDSLYELGDYISGVLTDAMNSIEWDDVYESAGGFGSGLASFLNGLLADSKLFGALGTTLAGTLNTVLHSIDSFGEEFDWTEFGNSIATGVNNFFDTFDFALLADTIDTWVQGIWDTIKTAIGKIKWETVWDGAKEFLSNIDLETIAIVVGAVTLKGLPKKILTAIPNAITLKNLKLIFSGYTFSFLGGPAFDVIGTEIILAVEEFIKNNFGEKVVTAMGEGLLIAIPTLYGLFMGGPIGAAIGGAIGIALDTFVINGEVITNFWKKLGEILFNFDITKTLLEDMKNFFQTAFSSDNFFSFGGNIILGIVAGFMSAIAFIAEPIGDFFDFVVGKICEIFGIHSPAEEMKPLGENILLGIVEGFTQSIKEWITSLTNWATETYSTFKTKIDEIITAVTTWFSQLPDKISNAISTTIQKVSDWGSHVFDMFKEKVNNTISNVVTWFSELPDKIYNEIIKIKEKITEWAGNAITFFQTEIPIIVDKVIEFFGEIPKKIVTVGEDIVTGLWNGIKNMVDWLGTNISGFVTGVIDGFKDGFDENSPSKIAFEIGDFWTIGLGNGMIGGFKDIYHEIDGFTANVAKIQIPTPKLNTDIPKLDFSSDSYNIGKLKTTMQMEMDARMAEQQFEIRQQNELLREQNELLRKIYSKPALSDDDVFNATRRGQSRFQHRTFKTGWAGVD